MFCVRRIHTGCYIAYNVYMFEHHKQRTYNVTQARSRNHCCSGKTIFFYFPNGRYIDCLSLTHATNKRKMLKLHHKYERKEIFKVNIRVPMIMSSHKKIVIEKEHSQFFIIFVLATQYRSLSVLLTLRRLMSYIYIYIWSTHS